MFFCPSSSSGRYTYINIPATNKQTNKDTSPPKSNKHANKQADALADPCPLPEKERSTLKSKETLLYAPMANVGAVRYDADAMYIDLRRLHYTKVRGVAV